MQDLLTIVEIMVGITLGSLPIGLVLYLILAKGNPTPKPPTHWYDEGAKPIWRSETKTKYFSPKSKRNLP